MPFILFLGLVAGVGSFLLPEEISAGPEALWAIRLGMRIFAGLMVGWAFLKR